MPNITAKVDLTLEVEVSYTPEAGNVGFDDFQVESIKGLDPLVQVREVIGGLRKLDDTMSAPNIRLAAWISVSPALEKQIMEQVEGKIFEDMAGGF